MLMGSQNSINSVRPNSYLLLWLFFLVLHHQPPLNMARIDHHSLYSCSPNPHHPPSFSSPSLSGPIGLLSHTFYQTRTTTILFRQWPRVDNFITRNKSSGISTILNGLFIVLPQLAVSVSCPQIFCSKNLLWQIHLPTCTISPRGQDDTGEEEEEKDKNEEGFSWEMPKILAPWNQSPSSSSCYFHCQYSIRRAKEGKLQCHVMLSLHA